MELAYLTQKCAKHGSHKIYIMPNLDQTGPQGRGPQTGRGLGPCANGRAYGRRFGFGKGGGLGLRRFWQRTPNANLQREGEKDFLENRAEKIQQKLNDIKERLCELNG